MDTKTVRCPECGANNRVSTEKTANGLAPVCGRCKKPLPESAEPMVVTDATFSESVERATIPVLLDLWAPWCPPCRMIAPMIDKLAAEMAGKVQFGKLNIDDNPATAQRFNVNSIPTLLIFKAGREVDRIVGVHSEAEIKNRLAKVAA